MGSRHLFNVIKLACMLLPVSNRQTIDFFILVYPVLLGPTGTEVPSYPSQSLNPCLAFSRHK